MRTRSPISTISYNTPSYLRQKLEELRRAKIISCWFFVCHKAEEDEKKDHIHLYIEPSKQLQTDDLAEEFIQPVPGEKPLKCLSWHSSKFNDWYLYSIHDMVYLASKQQSRYYTYTQDDVVSWDDDDLADRVHEVSQLSDSPYAKLISAIEQGLSWEEVVRRGYVPLPLIKQYEAAWFALNSGDVQRGKGKRHE